jgi:hypothetical protein
MLKCCTHSRNIQAAWVQQLIINWRLQCDYQNRRYHRQRASNMRQRYGTIILTLPRHQRHASGVDGHTFSNVPAITAAASDQLAGRRQGLLALMLIYLQITDVE